MPSFPTDRRPVARLLPVLLALAVTGPAWAAGDVLDVGDRRVVVAPLNLGVDAVDEVSAGLQPVTTELLLHLKEQGHRVATLERNSARKLWREVLTEARSEDPGVGVHDVYARFASVVAEQVEYGALVFPSLVMRAARVQGEVASWDGVDRQVEVPRPDDEVGTQPEGSPRLYSQGGRGGLAAASLHVAVFDRRGSLRFEGAGGLALLQEVARSESGRDSALAVALREDAFGDADELRQGIEAAFSRTLASVPASRAD